ncbi:MAG: hypothetical protein ABIQ65_17910 [Thermoanaerobaculia bacterium]
MQPPGEPLFKVGGFEAKAVRALTVPAHPTTTFDEAELKDLVAEAFSLTPEEKLDVIAQCGELTQDQIDSLLKILRDERVKFADMGTRHTERRWELEKEHAKQRVIRSQHNPTDSDDRQLAAADKAALLRAATETLLSFLGAGDARQVMLSFLARLAEQLERGELPTVTAVLPKLFAPELRNPTLNPNASDPEKDATLLTSLVRPTLSRIKATPVDARVSLRSRSYLVNLVLEGPEKSRGPVKLPYRISVQFRHDFSASLEQSPWRPVLGRKLQQLLTSYDPSVVFPLDRLGRFGPAIRRAVELAGYSNDGERAVFMAVASMKLVELLLPVLSDEEKARFLGFLLDLPLREGPVTGRFQDWFIAAAEIADSEEGDPFIEPFKTCLRDTDALHFREKLFFLGFFHRLPPHHEERARLWATVRGGTHRNREHGADIQLPAAVDVGEMVLARVDNIDDFVRVIDYKLDELFRGKQA